MKIYCYSIEENGSLASLPGEDWQRHREETKSPLWVHIEGGSVDQVHEVLAPLALHKLLLDGLLITLVQSPAERLSEFTDYLRSRGLPDVGLQAQRMVRLHTQEAP